MKDFGSKDLGYIAVIIVAFGLIAWLVEKQGKLADQVRIYEQPAQIAIVDPKDPVKNPFITGIECQILPCGQFTGKYRQCVVSCTVKRENKNSQNNDKNNE